MSKLIGYAFCLFVATLVAFAFSPRSEGARQPAQVDLTRVQINDLVRFDGGMVAVGERGLIVRSSDDGKTWQSRRNDDELPITLTGVIDLGDGALLAVGHDGLILRSADAGDSWTVVQHDGETGEPLLGAWSGDGRQVYAFGSFGKFLVSKDGGRTWAPGELPISGQHLNDMAGSADGRRMIVGEVGLVLRSQDGGASWEQIEPFYSGSLFGVAQLAGSHWVAYGMRGNVFVTADDGRSWTQVRLSHKLPLYGHAKNGDGVVIVGTGGAEVRLDGEGRLLSSGFLGGVGTLTSAVMLPGGKLFVAGQSGLLQERDVLQLAASAKK
ncbi:Ycf48-like protein precursor [compost metagenome]